MQTGLCKRAHSLRLAAAARGQEIITASLLFVALQGHDTSFTPTFYFLIDGDAATVECKMIFMHLC